MDTSCVNGLIKAAQQYQAHACDSNLVQLQRQLDVFIQVTNKSVPAGIIDQTQLATVDLFSALIALLNDSRDSVYQSTLSQKAMVVLYNLASEDRVSAALNDQYHVTALLVTYLRRHASADAAATLTCVKLLRRLTYGRRLSVQENYSEDFLQFLIGHAMAQHSELTEPCYSVLANLCTNNFSIQMLLKNMKNSKPLVKKLMENLCSSDHIITVCSLAILYSVYCKHDIGKSVFTAKNINQTFMLMFNILLNDRDLAVRTHIVDLFVYMLRDHKMQQLLSVYTHLHTCLKQVLAMLCEKPKLDNIRTSKIFELLLSFCSVNGLRCIVCKTLLESPTLKDPLEYKQLIAQPQLSEPFFAVIHWAAQSVATHRDAPLLALDFLRDIYEEMLTLGLNVSVSPRLDLILPMVTDVLCCRLHTDDPLLAKQCSKVVKALRLLSTLCSDGGLKLQVARVINSQTCANLVRFQLAHNHLTYMDSQSALQDWREEGVDVVLRTLEVMTELGSLVAGMQESLHQLLQDQQLMIFLAHGLTSTARERVQTSLVLLKQASALTEFPSILLGDSIVSLNNKKAAASEVKDLNVTPAPTRAFQPVNSHWSENKENISHLKDDVRSTSSTSRSGDLEHSVDMLVEKLQTGLEVKDMKTSEVLSVYQAKLQSLQTKESHVEDLLEAKSLALEQADRLIVQYRCKRVKAAAELNTLRTQLQNSEKCCEELKEQVNELMLTKERMANDIEELSQDNVRLEQTANKCIELQEAYTEQGFRLESAKKSIEALKQEQMTMAEMQEMLKRHNETLKQQHDVASQQLAELEEEKSLMSKQLKDREIKLQEYSKSMKRTDDRLKKLEHDRDELEVAIDGLRSELNRAEEKKKKQGHEIKTLELLVCEHEKNLKEKDGVIARQRAELDQHAEVAALIHKLSGNKPLDK